jgi:hypothetical protein
MLLLLACIESKDSDFTESVPIPDEPPPVVVVASDTSNQRVRFIRLDKPGLLMEVDLWTLLPDDCTPITTCLIFGVKHSLSATGEDQLTLLYEPLGRSSRMARFRLTDSGPVLDWILERLDLSAYPGLCSTTCPTIEEQDQLDRSCSLSQAHNFEILEETDTEVQVLIVDTGSPDRLVWARLSKDSTCGTVERIFDIIPDDHTNDLERWSENGKNYILLSHFSGTEDWLFGGDARFSLYEDTGSELLLKWYYPETGNFSAVHNPDRVVLGDRTFLVYAHSNGAGANLYEQDWQADTDHKGTIGVLELPAVEEPPVYLGEFRPDGLGFNRDASYKDGKVLVVDSGCFNNSVIDCPNQSLLWEVSLDLEVLKAQTVDGHFESDHLAQEIHPIKADLTMDCDLKLPYSGDYLEIDQLGGILQAALEKEPQSCETD